MMDASLEKQLIEYIVQELLRSTDRNKIIAEVCQRADISWVEGEYLLERTERENKRLLHTRKDPKRMFLGILAAGGGFLWFIVSLVRLLIPIVTFWWNNGRHISGVFWVNDFWNLLLQMVISLVLAVGGVVITQRRLKAIR
jgi:hypothetical protein